MCSKSKVLTFQMWTVVLGTTKPKNAHSDLQLIDSITVATRENFPIFSSHSREWHNPKKKPIMDQKTKSLAKR